MRYHVLGNPHFCKANTSEFLRKEKTLVQLVPTCNFWSDLRSESSVVRNIAD